MQPPCPPSGWTRRLAVYAPSIALVLSLAGCGTAPEAPETVGTWSGRPIGSPPARNPTLKQAMIRRANAEWDYFDRQVVVFKGSEESIPHVGAWEDDNYRYSGRVNAYWRAVGKPGLDGFDCKDPWSAAFISWVMQGAGVPTSQFKPAPAHWMYLSQMIDEASYPGRWFVPRRPADYSPQPGDLLCAYRNGVRPTSASGYTSARSVQGTPAHCDLVVANGGGTVEVIGGNVRNSVSKTVVELDGNGRVRAVPRRPWFLIMQNRL